MPTSRHNQIEVFNGLNLAKEILGGIPGPGQAPLRERVPARSNAEVGVFGHHPEPDFDFAIEADALEGEAYEVSVGLVSQWPFWGRLSRALRLGRRNDWFGRPDLEPFLRGLEGNATNRPSSEIGGAK